VFLATGRILCRLFYSFPARWWHRNIVRTGCSFNDFGKIVIIGTSGSTGRDSWAFGWYFAFSRSNRLPRFPNSDMANARTDDARAADVIKNWIRNRYTIELLGT